MLYFCPLFVKGTCFYLLGTLGKTVIASHNGRVGGGRAFLLHLSFTESESIPGTSVVIVDVKKNK